MFLECPNALLKKRLLATKATKFTKTTKTTKKGKTYFRLFFVIFVTLVAYFSALYFCCFQHSIRDS